MGVGRDAVPFQHPAPNTYHPSSSEDKMTKQDIAATPVEIEIGGESYRFSPLTMSDLIEFEQWVKDRRLNTALRACGEDWALRQRVILDMMDSDAPAFHSDLLTAAGQMHAIYLSARHLQPGVSEKALGDKLTAQGMAEILIRMGVIRAGDGSPEDCASKKKTPPITRKAPETGTRTARR